jgi:GTP-binding protein EngB required for normal cell division
MSSKSVTQSKTKDLIERQHRLKVMMEVLVGKMDKLSTKMNNRHDIPCKENEVKRSTR